LAEPINQKRQYVNT